MDELINFCLNGGDKDMFNRYVQQRCLSINKTPLTLAIKYLLDNSYFTLRSMGLPQLMGIPMDSDSTPFMTNLFLYCYERKQLLQTKNKTCERLIYFQIFLGLQITYKLSNTDEFENNQNEVCPNELIIPTQHRKWRSLLSFVLGPFNRSP